MTKEDVLKNCTVEGNNVKLPEGQLDRKLYLEVAKALNLIGGKWKGGKTMAFVFSQDPTELLAQIANGEKKNLKKEFQFFATPDDLADRLVELANINLNHLILEPSAGQGAIVKAINRKLPEKIVDCYELMDINRSFLDKIPTVYFIGKDFLNPVHHGYDRIIANPPFTKNQDIDHIRHMYDMLKPDGILVSLASMHWRLSNNKKEIAFRKWLDEVADDIHDVAEGTFKESGTMIRACIIRITKR